MDLAATNEAQQRQAVIAEALTWERTPHHNGAKIKGVGVDCGQFPIMVYSSLGLMPFVETGHYRADFHLHREEEWYKRIADANGRTIEGPPGPGDFCLYKIGRVYSHGAIVIEWPTIIHAALGLGVVQDIGNQGFLSADKKGVKRPVLFYTLWGRK